MLKYFYNQILFFTIWVVILVLHTFILNIECNIDLWISFIDSFVFNTLFFILGIAIWFMVRYTNLFKRSTFDIIINYFSFAAIFVFIWIVLSTQILKFVISSSDYSIFINQSIVYRSIIGLFMYISMVLFFYLRQNLESFKQRIQFESNMNNMLKESQLQVLRSQINPHFLFNSLNSLNSLIVSNPDKASEMLIELSNYMRYSINTVSEQFTKLHSEIIQIERYVSIEKIRFGKRLVFDIEICEQCPEIEIPSMLLQPLVENAIKHGLYTDLEGVKIQLKISKEANWLLIDISNNFDSEKTSPIGTGLGLRNIRERLLKLYGRNDLINISNENNLFIVKIKIPIHEKI